MPNLGCILFLGHGINYFLERHRDQLDDALSEYKEAVRLDHFDSRALLQLVATRENAGRYRAAIARCSPLTARRRS